MDTVQDPRFSVGAADADVGVSTSSDAVVFFSLRRGLEKTMLITPLDESEVTQASAVDSTWTSDIFLQFYSKLIRRLRSTKRTL